MRSLVGLIVGVGLGTLLTYFSLTAFRVTELALSQPPQRQDANGGQALLAPDAADAGRRQRELTELGRTAANHLMETCMLNGTVIVLDSSHGLEDAATITEAFRATLDTSTTIQILQAKRLHGLLDGPLAAAALFCADHDDLRDLTADASTRGRPLPPLYTAGWSPWLDRVCTQSPSPVAGVALTVSGRALRDVNPVLGEADTSSPPQFSDLASMAVVFVPADLVALCGGSDDPSVEVKEPVDAKAPQRIFQGRIVPTLLTCTSYVWYWPNSVVTNNAC